MDTHEASDLRGPSVPCACGRKVSLVNLQPHRDRDNDVTHWTGDCPHCGSHHTIFND